MCVDIVFERPNIANCEYRLHFTVDGVSVNVFAFKEFFENLFELGSFIRPYSQWFKFRDHATKSFSSFLCTLSSDWLETEFSRLYINSDKKVFNTIVLFSQLVYKSQINRPDLIDIVSKIFQTGKTSSFLSVLCT